MGDDRVLFALACVYKVKVPYLLFNVRLIARDYGYRL